jgi:alkanesulfonate monooxygenase SsuD/methylene tetrahydromethanopterin reductase-like flavin-dependent oxidoreductase (luciferase family)
MQHNSPHLDALSTTTNPAALPRENSLGIVLSTVTDSSAETLVHTGVLAEEAGFDAVYINEGRGDALAAALAIALATKKIHVGTNIANIYFRHAYLAAHTARTIGEFSKGRFILGLGMSHRSLLASLGIEMGDARRYLEDYTREVKSALAGNLGQGFLKTDRAPFVPPVFVAGNTIESAAIAGRAGDGIMPFLSPKSYLPTLTKAARDASPDQQSPCIMSIPTFLHEDIDLARSAARYNLAFFALLPNYRKQWRRAGFKDAMDKIKAAASNKSRRELAEEIPDELVEQVCIFGSVQQCTAQIAEFRQAGADQPVLAVSPVNNDRQTATENAIKLLAPS